LLSKEQLGIIAAGVVAFMAMAAHDNWIGQLATWVAKTPQPTNLTNTTGAPGGTQGLNNVVVPVPGFANNPVR
jgi:hypothetical protein